MLRYLLLSVCLFSTCDACVTSGKNGTYTVDKMGLFE